jgi:hypothetical protein
LIGLDWGNPNVNKHWKDFPERQKRELTRTWRRQFTQFVNLENGEYVVVVDGQRHLLGIGIVRDPPTYKYRPDLGESFFRHVRKVRWLVDYEWQKRPPVRIPGFRNTIVRVNDRSMFWPLTRFRFLHAKPVPRIAREKARARREVLERKYGPGGEGPAHKRLKELILNNPEKLGFGIVLKAHEEYGFDSGDRADIVFDLQKGRYAVVEIETDNPMPGAFQALKYKVLKCAELGLDIKSTKVEAMLVASTKPEDMTFCGKYDVHFLRWDTQL